MSSFRSLLTCHFFLGALYLCKIAKSASILYYSSLFYFFANTYHYLTYCLFSFFSFWLLFGLPLLFQFHKIRALGIFTPVSPTFKTVLGPKKGFNQYLLNKSMPVQGIYGFDNALMFSSDSFWMEEYDIWKYFLLFSKSNYQSNKCKYIHRKGHLIKSFYWMPKFLSACSQQKCIEFNFVLCIIY